MYCCRYRNRQKIHEQVEDTWTGRSIRTAIGTRIVTGCIGVGIGLGTNIGTSKGTGTGVVIGSCKYG